MTARSRKDNSTAENAEIAKGYEWNGCSVVLNILLENAYLIFCKSFDSSDLNDMEK
jgi:hypothetical protein